MPVGIVTNAVKRALWYAAVPGLVREGYSFNRAQIFAVARRFSYRRDEMRRVWNTIQGRATNQDLVEVWPRNKLPEPSIMNEEDLGRIGRYRVYGKETWTDRYTGEEKEGWISFYDDERYPFEEWETRYLATEVEDPSDPTKENRKVIITNIAHQVGVRY